MIHIFHHNDHDGIAAAAIIYRYHINEKDYIKFYMVDYTMDLDLSIIDEGDIVYFVDYSFSKGVKDVLLLNTRCIDVIWIDHHKTSVEIDNTLKLANIDIPGYRMEGYCGATLTKAWFDLDGTKLTKEALREYCDNMKMTELLYHIDRWDTFKKPMLDETLYTHYGIQSSDPTDSIWDLLIHDYADYPNYKSIFSNIINLGKSVYEYIVTDSIQYHMDMYGFVFYIDGHKCFAINRKCNSIEFGPLYEKYDIVCPFYYNGKRWTYSLYTRLENIDVSKYCRELGGGGHPGAAGFTSDRLLITDGCVLI